MSRISSLITVAEDIETELVPIPRWGCEVLVKGMDAASRSDYLTRLMTAREEGDPVLLADIEADLIVTCTFDPEDKTPVFDDGDKPMLLTKAGDIVGALSTKAMRLSGLDAKAEERLGKAFLDSTPAPMSSAGSISS